MGGEATSLRVSVKCLVWTKGTQVGTDAESRDNHNPGTDYI